MSDHATSTTEGARRLEPLEPLIPRIRVTPSERNRLILAAIAVLIVLWLLERSLGALVPFILALVLGYLMLPLVDLLDRVMPRVVAILLVYLVFIAGFWGLIAWFAPVVSRQVDELSQAMPKYTEQVREWSTDVTSWYNALPISQDVRNSIETGARNAFGSVAGGVQQAAVNTLRAVTGALGFVVGLVIIPFWLFYVLKDKDRGITAFNNMMPRHWRGDVWRIVRIVNGVFSSYIRGQLLLGLVVGIASTIGLVLVGAPYPVVLGIISGLTEIIPVVGPILGAIPGLLLAIFHPEGWVMVLKVLAVYVVVQQLENNLLVPKIQGDSVKLHPSIIMVALVIGSQVGGLFGLIVAVPVAAVMRDIYLYLYRRFGEHYTPRDAEASVPSRQHEESDAGKKKVEAELSRQRELPGVNSTDEMVADLSKSREEVGTKD